MALGPLLATPSALVALRARAPSAPIVAVVRDDARAIDVDELSCWPTT